MIFTHPAHFDSAGRLRVDSYHRRENPTGCDFCPAYMCKGLVLRNYLKSVASNKTYLNKLIVGDSHGDFCPCRELKSATNDHILARKGLSLESTIRARSHEIHGNVHYWDSYETMRDLFQKILSK